MTAFDLNQNMNSIAELPIVDIFKIKTGIVDKRKSAGVSINNAAAALKDEISNFVLPSYQASLDCWRSYRETAIHDRNQFLGVLLASIFFWVVYLIFPLSGFDVSPALFGFVAGGLSFVTLFLLPDVYDLWGTGKSMTFRETFINGATPIMGIGKRAIYVSSGDDTRTIHYDAIGSIYCNADKSLVIQSRFGDPSCVFEHAEPTDFTSIQTIVDMVSSKITYQS